MTQCIQCDVLVPELERQLSVLRETNRKLRMSGDPLNPGHREKLIETERRVSVLSDCLGKSEAIARRAVALLRDAEPAGNIYVDPQKRGDWRAKRKELLEETEQQ